MHKCLKPILQQDTQMLYSDTDSALLEIPKGHDVNLKFGSSYREAKSVILR